MQIYGHVGPSPSPMDNQVSSQTDSSINCQAVTLDPVNSQGPWQVSSQTNSNRIYREISVAFLSKLFLSSFHCSASSSSTSSSLASFSSTSSSFSSFSSSRSTSPSSFSKMASF